MSIQLERILADEALEEAQMFGNPEVPTEPPATIVPLEEAPSELPAPIEEEGEKKKRENWKKRHINYKSATDITIRDLRLEVADLRGDLAGLMETIQTERSLKREVPSDPFDGVFTQEDKDTFGADGLDVVKRATSSVLEKQVKPLQDRLDVAEKFRAEELKRKASATKASEYDSFLGNLSILVPNYAELNTDAEFLKWMGTPDPYSGLERGSLFRRAEAARDVARVAEFFVEYTSALETPEAPPDEMDKHITPVGSSSAAPVAPQSNEPDGEVLLSSEIDTFYDDVMKGRYKGRQSEVLAIEARIDTAAMKGNIRQG
jgi:hypothetical protein